MPDFVDIGSSSGEQFSFGGQITKPATQGAPPPWPNYPTNAAGYKLQFAAKRKKTDSSYVVKKDTTLNPGDVTLANGGAWTVRIVHADTTDFTKTELLSYDVVLIEPDGTETVVCKGTWKVDKSVGL